MYENIGVCFPIRYTKLIHQTILQALCYVIVVLWRLDVALTEYAFSYLWTVHHFIDNLSGWVYFAQVLLQDRVLICVKLPKTINKMFSQGFVHWASLNFCWSRRLIACIEGETLNSVMKHVSWIFQSLILNPTNLVNILNHDLVFFEIDFEFIEKGCYYGRKEEAENQKSFYLFKDIGYLFAFITNNLLAFEVFFFALKFNFFAWLFNSRFVKYHGFGVFTFILQKLVLTVFRHLAHA